MYNNVEIISQTYEDMASAKDYKFVHFNHPTAQFDDSNLRNAVEYLEIIYITRN